MPNLKLLSNDDIESIHVASLEVLEKTGITVNNSQATQILANVGCKVESNIVTIPSSVIDEFLGKAPESFKLYTRDGLESHIVGGDNVIFNPGSSAIYITDSDSGEIRKAVTRDMVNLVQLVDNLDHIHAQSTAVVPTDVPGDISEWYRLYLILKNSTKPIVTGAFSKDGLLTMKRILEIVSGGSENLAKEPKAIFDCCPTSPLIWGDVSTQNLIDCATAGIPAEIVSAPQMGATSTVTIAGTLVQSNVEFLTGAVISQIINPGTPIIYGGCPAAFDMRTTSIRLGAVEAMMVASATAELGKNYGIPTHAYLGLSDSKTLDAQSGFEATLSVTIAALSRINVVSGAGMLTAVNCQSLEKLVFDNEICGTALRLIEGIRVDSTTLASDLIMKVGAGGHYLAEKHTRENLRKERLIPTDILSRESSDSWKKSGAKETRVRAKEIVDTKLRNHITSPLDEQIDGQLEDYLKDIVAKKGHSFTF